jgi:hypothetical protein
MENKFIDKQFKECEGGYYDENNFYISPNGSFWDPDGVYFNKEGFDRHGGFYDANLEYQPGKGWIKELMCYEDERGEEDGMDEDDDNDDILDELYINNNMDVIEGENAEKKKEVFKPGNKNIKSSNNKDKVIETVITPDMLFNKVPESIIPKDIQNQKQGNTKSIIPSSAVKTIKKVELDDLFS